MGTLVQIGTEFHKVLQYYKIETGMDFGEIIERALMNEPEFVKWAKEHKHFDVLRKASGKKDGGK